MKLTAIILLLWTSSLIANPLPRWVDETREEKLLHDVPMVLRSQPPANFRLAAEYEPAQAVVLGHRGFSGMLRDIGKFAHLLGGVEIWSANGPNSLPGVQASSYRPVYCNLDTVWMRDYGPVGILEGAGKVAIVDTIYRHYAYRVRDDRLPTCLSEQLDLSPYSMDLILDGGNLMVDSKGNLFMTKRTYLWNSNKSKEKVDALLKRYFNVHTVHAIDYAGYPGQPVDGTGHIDMIVKLLSDDTVLISTANHPQFKKAVDKAVAYFLSIKTPSGGEYKILRSPGYYKWGTWYTYTNSLIVNKAVLIPEFSNAGSKNSEAKKVYEQGLPGYVVKGINSDASITSGGSIHCITQLIPKI